MCQDLKILLIDDEPYWLETLSDIFKRWGLKLTVARNGVDAIRCFPEERFGLVITDFDMPGMNGIELTRNLRNLTTGIPVILMSGDDTIRTSRYAKEAGINAYISKSDNPDEIRKCIERVMNMSLTCCGSDKH